MHFRLALQCEKLICSSDLLSFHAERDFNDTVIVTEVPVAQTLLVQAIEIFDDEINEGREVFNVSLEVVSNISNAVQYRIQTTLCRIRLSDRKLFCKFACILCPHLRIEILLCQASCTVHNIAKANYHYNVAQLCKSSLNLCWTVH